MPIYYQILGSLVSITHIDKIKILLMNRFRALLGKINKTGETFIFLFFVDCGCDSASDSDY